MCSPVAVAVFASLSVSASVSPSPLNQSACAYVCACACGCMGEIEKGMRFGVFLVSCFHFKLFFHRTVKLREMCIVCERMSR